MREGQLGRRSFLAASSLALASAAAPSLGADEKAAKSAGNSKRANPIGISTYSFWRFLDDSKVPVERLLSKDYAKELRKKIVSAPTCAASDCQSPRSSHSSNASDWGWRTAENNAPWSNASCVYAA